MIKNERSDYMKIIQKAKTSQKSYSKKNNVAAECRAECKKCPPMTC
jgi:hypothetical protein